MKALNYLRSIRAQACEYKNYNFTSIIIELEEAIAELEALQSRTCESCKFVCYRKSDGCSYCDLNNTVYCDPVKEKFCCNRYEAKEQQ